MGIFNFFKKKIIIKQNHNNIDKKEIIFNDRALKILSINQQKLKPILEYFSTISFLWWWTAISLQLWHRKSIDFDFFTDKSILNYYEFEKIIKSNWFEIDKESREKYRWIELENQDEIHVKIEWVNFTLCNYYRTLYNDQKIKINWNSYILNWLRIATIKELACMKLYAMMTRNKWKDAVDLYFILNNSDYSLDILLQDSEHYFLNIFRKDLVLETLLIWEWDTTEKVEYTINNYPLDEKIIDFLKKEVIKIL